jgi:hypothetical protein
MVSASIGQTVQRWCEGYRGSCSALHHLHAMSHAAGSSGWRESKTSCSTIRQRTSIRVPSSDGWLVEGLKPAFRASACACPQRPALPARADDKGPFTIEQCPGRQQRASCFEGQ